jgi:hypothetical protein
MQTKGADGSGGKEYWSKMFSMAATKSALCFGGMHQRLRMWGLKPFF